MSGLTLRSMRIVLLLGIGLLLPACAEKHPPTLSLGHEAIQFITLHNKQGYSRTLMEPSQISTVIHTMLQTHITEEVLRPVTPNRTPEEDYMLQVFYYPDRNSKNHQKSYFVWVDKERQRVHLAPVQQGTTYLYRLAPSAVGEFVKLLE